MNIALYRKYRPRDFDSVIGQEHITVTLKNQIKSDRIGHAYLFCGSRGVGKTSLARIFARAISCKDKDNAPCGKCEVCTRSQDESNLDIIEIDAASNNGVDDARELREKVKYPPIIGKYKVYIIDEVHMLTGSAFNALLKTLEEPPGHVVFVLATTEPHKLPATILSRCMRFDFRLVSLEQLVALIASIYDSEGKEYDTDALRAIAAAAEGSARDALSLADTCLTISSGRLTTKDVSKVLGGGNQLTIALFNAISENNLKDCLEIIQQLYESGKSMNVVAKELCQYARDLMVAKTAPSVLKTTQEQAEKLIESAKSHTITSLAAIVQLFSEMDNTLRYSVSPRIAMESAMLRAIKLYSLDINALDERILRLEQKLDNLMLRAADSQTKIQVKSQTLKASDKPNQPTVDILNTSDKPNQPTIDSPIDQPDLPPEFIPTNEPEFLAVQPTSNQQPIKNEQDIKLSPRQLWGRMITYFRRNSTPSFTQVIGNQDPNKIKIKNQIMTIYAARDNFLKMCDQQLLDTLKQGLLSEGYDYKILVEKDASDIDMEKEVTSLFDEFGKNKVNIIK